MPIEIFFFPIIKEFVNIPGGIPVNRMLRLDTLCCQHQMFGEPYVISIQKSNILSLGFSNSRISGDRDSSIGLVNDMETWIVLFI